MHFAYHQFYQINSTYFCDIQTINRSGRSVVDNTLDYQSRDRKIDPCFSGLSDETLNWGPILVWPHCWWDLKPEFTHLPNNQKTFSTREYIQEYNENIASDGMLYSRRIWQFAEMVCLHDNYMTKIQCYGGRMVPLWSSLSILKWMDRHFLFHFCVLS